MDKHSHFCTCGERMDNCSCNCLDIPFWCGNHRAAFGAQGCHNPQLATLIVNPDNLAKEIWKEFMNQLAIHVFGEKEAIAGHKIHNLLGSADHHRQIFMRAAHRVFEDFRS